MIKEVPTNEEAVAVCAFEGELDLSAAQHVETEIVRALESHEYAIADLTGCAYLDSTILSVLIRVTAQFPRRFCIVIPDGAKIWRIFQITSLANELPIELSLDIARRRWDIAESA